MMSDKLTKQAFFISKIYDIVMILIDLRYRLNSKIMIGVNSEKENFIY